MKHGIKLNNKIWELSEEERLKKLMEVLWAVQIMAAISFMSGLSSLYFGFNPLALVSFWSFLIWLFVTIVIKSREKWLKEKGEAKSD